jgi:hypothetical protein
MAACGNISLVRDMAGVMRVEARALWNEHVRRGAGPFANGAGLFYWSPTMNLGRDPRWGRFQESISEVRPVPLSPCRPVCSLQQPPRCVPRVAYLPTGLDDCAAVRCRET